MYTYRYLLSNLHKDEGDQSQKFRGILHPDKSGHADTRHAMAVTMVDKTDAMLASETADKITSTFGVKEYDVSPGILCCPILCPQTLTLEAEEVVYIRKSPCDTATKRMPYGQLGSVDAKTACGCCIAVDSQLTAGSDEGISPKCGCETALVKEIVEEV